MKYFLLITISIMLSGCASVPANYGKPPVGSKIGIVLLINKTPTHAHVGTTIFQNTNTGSSSTANFNKKFGSEITSLLIRSGHNIKIIEPTPSLIESRTSLFSYVSSSTLFKDQNKLEIEKLAKDHNLDFVVLVYPTSGPAWPNSSAYIEGYGLYTRCSFGTCDAFALDYISARIYDVKNHSALKSMNSLFFSQQKMPNIVVPDEIKNIRPSQIDQAGNLALKNFMILFKKMLGKSEFLSN